MNQNRIRWIDMAKGYGMLCVILGHLQYGYIGDYVYTFHIPLFFFLSGYVFKTYDSFGTFIKKKTKTMLLPYFGYGFILMLAEVFMKLGCTAWGWKAALKMLFIQERHWTLWFLACLFWLEMVYYLLVRICRGRLLPLSIICVLMTVGGVLYFQHFNGPVLPWNVDTVPTAMLFFHVGYLLKQGEFVEYFIHCKRRWVLWVNVVVLFAIHWGLNAWNLHVTGTHLEMYEREYANPVLTYLCAFVGIFMVLIVSARTTNPIIRYMGKNSLVFFALHQSVVIPILQIMTYYTGWLKDGYRWKNHLIYMVGYTVLIIAIMAVITECIHLVKSVRNRLQC